MLAMFFAIHRIRLFQTQLQMLKDIEVDISNYKPNMDGLEHINQVKHYLRFATEFA